MPTAEFTIRPPDFHVDEVHRFEGMNNPDDSAILFAVKTHTGVKGLLVDAYGAYTNSLSPEMVKRLLILKPIIDYASLRRPHSSGV